MPSFFPLQRDYPLHLVSYAPISREPDDDFQDFHFIRFTLTIMAKRSGNRLFLLGLILIGVEAFVSHKTNDVRRVAPILDATNSNDSSSRSGLYRKFADHAKSRLLESEIFQEMTNIPEDLLSNCAPAAGGKAGKKVVKISTSAMVPTTEYKHVVSYARVALLETIPDEDVDEAGEFTDGIQVLNFVVIPSDKTNLPVLGIDLVTLPGGPFKASRNTRIMSWSFERMKLSREWRTGLSRYFTIVSQ